MSEPQRIPWHKLLGSALADALIGLPYSVSTEEELALRSQRFLQKTGIQLHAYVLMTNHVHLLLPELGASPEVRQAAYCERFLRQIEQMTGQRRAARPRGRPRMEPDGPVVLPGQMELGL